jgi:hypothetical protein
MDAGLRMSSAYNPPAITKEYFPTEILVSKG